MPMNNNQKVQSAAARLTKLPLVHSACTKLSVLYIDTKCSHPNLRSVCEVLESSVTAAVSPVIVKLEPQISIANDIACKSLDWLETAFPVLHTPTEQIVDKMHEIRDVVSIAATGTRDCVEHTVAWLMGGIQRADQSLLERVISVASLGLDSALIMSEALMDRVLPPTEEDKEEEAHLVEGFEAATLRRKYPVRLVSLATKLCRRTYHVMQSVQDMSNLSRPSDLVQDLQSSWMTLAWSIQMLPQYLQHQLISALFFISQMYNLGCPPPHHRLYQDRSSLNAAETPSTQNDALQVAPPATPAFRTRRPTKIPAFDNGCNVKGCVSR
ncbi:perilipin-2-like [Plectropomus leopardus]|uniref:perilipin-2-like n=1 Tax=Plectropomus leopardus TaxID=160734 RepID=UPI001C4AD2A0|nr:perilipin-2-like [Plectropomus leopardus]XP_042341433.1 perilipin-2-like [Plectropomus leopardus]